MIINFSVNPTTNTISEIDRSDTLQTLKMQNELQPKQELKLKVTVCYPPPHNLRLFLSFHEEG